MTSARETSYINYPALLSPNFSPHDYANTLVLSTNTPSDPASVDLSTPLSRVLFDVQEVDTHIHNLTSKAALPILDYTRIQTGAARRMLGVVETEVQRLTESYKRLEKEVLERHSRADEARRGAERSLVALRLGSSVQRAVGLGRQLEALMDESGLGEPGKVGREDYRVLIRASYSILGMRELMAGEEGKQLRRINLFKALQTSVFDPNEEKVRNGAQQIIREFSMSNLASTATPGQGTSTMPVASFAQTEDSKERTICAVTILYLLSTLPPMDLKVKTPTDFQPDLLLKALQMYLHTALTSSSAAVARALATLPTLERTLSEVSARCQNIGALETLLAGARPPAHPLLAHESTTGDDKESLNDLNLLKPLLHSLDTSSLQSYFWRSLASSLSSRVQDILSRGGVSARTLRSNKDRVRDEIRQCVLRGSQVPSGISRKGQVDIGNWEREAAVMVGSVLGVLGR